MTPDTGWVTRGKSPEAGHGHACHLSLVNTSNTCLPLVNTLSPAMTDQAWIIQQISDREEKAFDIFLTKQKMHLTSYASFFHRTILAKQCGVCPTSDLLSPRYYNLQLDQIPDIHCCWVDLRAWPCIDNWYVFSDVFLGPESGCILHPCIILYHSIAVSYYDKTGSEVQIQDDVLLDSDFMTLILLL